MLPAKYLQENSSEYFLFEFLMSVGQKTSVLFTGLLKVLFMNAVEISVLFDFHF